jgi:hypothetical protein
MFGNREAKVNNKTIFTIAQGMKQMTATSEFMNSRSQNVNDTSKHSEISGRFDGGTTVLRNALRVLGAAFVLASLAMWLAPGATWDSELMLMKLGASLICALCGLALMQMIPAPEKGEIQFDAKRREVRIIDGASAKTVLRRSYDSLGGAKVTRDVVTLWDTDGSELASFPIANDDTRRALSRQLDTLCA